MIYIALGCLGFLAIHLLDFVSLKRVPWVKPFTWIPGTALLVYALGKVSFQSDMLPLSPGYVGVGWALLLASLSLLIYSLFVNLPFRETYLTAGVGNRLVTTGLYALVRHPGVPWFVLFMLSLLLVSRSSLLLIAAPVFIIMDMGLVVVQDRWLFGRMFAGYDSYRRQTPMLLPNRQSIIAFFKSLGQQSGLRVVIQGGTDGRDN